ncbi:MAG: hypothetical protein EA356_00690 [Geminicoccaceae bacterium]|nr:MAG: hypothetical protein EA356_00690 [Geminicoccaceae bacterium]
MRGLLLASVLSCWIATTGTAAAAPALSVDAAVRAAQPASLVAAGPEWVPAENLDAARQALSRVTIDVAAEARYHAGFVVVPTNGAGQIPLALTFGLPVLGTALILVALLAYGRAPRS